jgi:hypothetical protein
MQGNKKSPECPFNHEIEGTDVHGTRVRGKLIQHECEVKFYFIMPIIKNGKPSTNKMVVISYGEHTHPPPPPRKIPATVKEAYAKVFREFGLSEVTARVGQTENPIIDFDYNSTPIIAITVIIC